MTMAEMIRRMEELGTPQEAMLVMREYLSRDVTRDVRDGLRDKQRDMARERQRRHRAKLKAEKGLAEANDAASTAPPERDEARDAGRDARIAPCDLSSLPSLKSEEGNRESKKEKKKEKGGDTRARGTRLTSDAALSDADRAFAVSEGVHDPEALWVEFVDYWIGVPGARGTKLDWSATWRNRVRAVASRKGYTHGKPQRTELQAALDKTRQFARSGD